MPRKVYYENFSMGSTRTDSSANLDTLQLDEQSSFGLEVLQVLFPLPGMLCPTSTSFHLPVLFLLLPLGGPRLQQVPVLGSLGFFPHPSPDSLTTFPHYYPDHSGKAPLMWGLTKAPARCPSSCRGCGLLTPTPLPPCMI